MLCNFDKFLKIFYTTINQKSFIFGLESSQGSLFIIKWMWRVVVISQTKWAIEIHVNHMIVW